MEFNKTKPIALGIAFTLALTPIHAITYADTNSDSASINVQTAQTEYKSGFVFTKSTATPLGGVTSEVFVFSEKVSMIGNRRLEITAASAESTFPRR